MARTKKAKPIVKKKFVPCTHKRIFKLEMFLTCTTDGKQKVDVELTKTTEEETVISLLEKYVEKHKRTQA